MKIGDFENETSFNHKSVRFLIFSSNSKLQSIDPEHHSLLKSIKYANVHTLKVIIKIDIMPSEQWFE